MAVAWINQSTTSGTDLPRAGDNESVLKNRERTVMQHPALSFLLAVAVGASTFSAAQMSGFSNSLPTSSQLMGQPTILGVVAGSDGLPLNNIRIEVHALTNGMVVASSYSLQDGSFEVSNLRSGTYEVVAEDGVNQATERVSVDGMPVNITLRMQNRSSASPKTGTVSVSELRTPEKARHLAEKAHNALVKNHRDEAEKNVEQALQIAPDYARALTLRAVLKLSKGHPDAAMDDLDHAVKSDPTYGEAYLVLGAVYNELGRSDEALRSLDRASMYEPNSWQCAFEESKAWMAKKDYAHALLQLGRAQTLGGPSVAGPVHLLRGYALVGAKQLEQAANELEAYLTADPNSNVAGSVRLELARIKTQLAQKATDTMQMPAVTGLFAAAH
ncbi:MAG TPA: tetratricopeptide repeat protein [Candidatus Koribacter sp.]|jgi:Tfp pilus assembly protein PilF